MRLKPLALTVVCFATMLASAVAQDGDTTDLANQLGTVIGSEQACGLSYDQDAIQRFINDHVSASDMEFPTMLSTMVDGTKVEIESMSQSALTAHCTQIRRIAKHYGFTD
jgi:hypothetical protein